MTLIWRIVRPDGEQRFADLERARGGALEWWSNRPRDLGDLTWVAGEHLPLLAPGVADELRRFDGWEPAPVAVREHQMRASDQKPGKRLPAALLARAQALVHLRVTKVRPPAPASTIRVVRPGPAPELHWGGRGIAYEVLEKGDRPLSVVEGVESWETVGWQPGKGMLRAHYEREPGRGLHVDDASGLFVLEGAERWVLCADGVKRLAEEQGWTNVAFLAAGETTG